MYTRLGPCLLALAGCVSYGKTEDDDDEPPGWSWFFDGGSSGSDDSGSGTNSPGGPDFSVSWGGSSMTLSISGGSGSYWFGMAETGCADPGNCWYGEDCLYGDLTGTYYYCHPADSNGVTLQYTSDLDLDESSETLLNESLASDVTYYVESASSGECWAWGHDTSYYAALDCENL